MNTTLGEFNTEMKVVLFCQLLLSWVTTADHLLPSQHPPLSHQASLFILPVCSLSAANTNLKAVGSINVVAWVQITDNYPQRNTFSLQTAKTDLRKVVLLEQDKR